ncbi:geranylgeranylglycerol-phosphate geranylgeranyltransferase [Candidatus Micrarchaeota archaeon]|nr:geranylgeranylglycerol-phosphate geranylgeranyltransferase [Candidatus Micrarchaeota archaeon]
MECETLRDWWRLARAEHALMVFFAIIVSEIIVLKGSFSLDSSLFFPALGPILITLASFIINDYFDYPTDKANKRVDRPLVSGGIKRQDALVASILLFFFGILSSFFVNAYCFLLAFSYAFLSVIYTPVLKRIPAAGNAFVATTYPISFLYGNFAESNTVLLLVTIFSITAFFAGLGREFLNTLRDVRGDRKSGISTLPMIIGAKRTVLFSSVAFGLAVFASWLPIVFPFKLNLFFILVMAVADTFFLMVVFKSMRDHSLKTLRECRNLSLLGMVVGLLAFASLAF